MKTMPRSALAVSLLAAFGLTSAANANIIPEELFFSQNAGFEVGGLQVFVAPSRVRFAGNSFDVDGKPARDGLEWDGSTSGTSELDIFSYNSADSDTKFGVDGIDPVNEGGDSQWNQGEFWVITELFQTNNVIVGGPFPDPMWTVNVLADLSIFFDAGQTELLVLSSAVTSLSFYETLNTADAGDCFYANISGTPGCSDIYRTAAIGFQDVTKTVDGITYTFVFDVFAGPSTGGNLPRVFGRRFVLRSTLEQTEDSVPILLVQDDLLAGNIVVATPEASPGFSSVYVRAAWFATADVPAPATLGLLGLGLVGFGFAVRRRQAREMKSV